MATLLKEIKKYSSDYLKAAPENFDKRIEIFDQNILKLQAMVKDEKVSAEDKKKINSFVDASFAVKSVEAVAEILSKFIKKDHTDTEIEQAILKLAIIDIISRIRGDLEAQNRTSPITDFDKLLEIIDETPDIHEIISNQLGGEKNNKNKSKKNKKTNKNKTKKRKISSSKKIKFSKVKKL